MLNFEILFESFEQNFSRAHIFHTNMQKDVVTKLAHSIAYSDRTYALNVEFEILFESFEHNSSRAHIFHTNMQTDVATKYTYCIP